MNRILLLSIIVQSCSSQNQEPIFSTNLRIESKDVEDTSRHFEENNRQSPKRMFPPNCDPKNPREDDDPLVKNGCINSELCKNSGICPLVYFPVCGCDGKFFG
jgi:hypothetical protein